MKRRADFPKGLNGRFHGLVADRARGTVMLFNDRYGLQRLYYHEAKDTVLLCGRGKGNPKGSPGAASTDPRGYRRIHCLRLRARKPDALFRHPCSASWLGLVRSGVGRSKRKRLLRAARMGTGRAAQAGGILSPICVTFSCGICRAISTEASGWAFRSPAAWTRASSWRGARLRLIRCLATRSAACIATTRTCNWRDAWQRFVASNTKSSPRAGVPLTIPVLRRAHHLSDRRLRGP